MNATGCDDSALSPFHTPLRCRVKSAPSTPYTITAAFLPTHIMDVSYHTYGLLFRDSGTGKIHSIAERFEGVEQCYAIAAGREVRVLVRPEEVDDKGATLLARKIATQIEEEVRFPGSIRVTVIRETRSFDVAR